MSTATFPVWDSTESAHWWDEVPVLPSTVLGLELLLNEPVVDLRRIADLILSDLGATLHTLRMAATEDAVRVEDCLAAVELSTWFEMLSARRMEFETGVARCWRHAVEIARYARFVSESMESVAPDTAYLVGLLHELDTLPRVLGCTNLTGKCPHEGLLPATLRQVLEEAHSIDDSPWKHVVEVAHQLTCARPSPRPLIPLSSSQSEAMSQ